MRPSRSQARAGPSAPGPLRLRGRRSAGIAGCECCGVARSGRSLLKPLAFKTESARQRRSRNEARSRARSCWTDSSRLPAGPAAWLLCTATITWGAREGLGERKGREKEREEGREGGRERRGRRGLGSEGEGEGERKEREGGGGEREREKGRERGGGGKGGGWRERDVVVAFAVLNADAKSAEHVRVAVSLPDVAPALCRGCFLPPSAFRRHPPPCLRHTLVMVDRVTRSMPDDHAPPVSSLDRRSRRP